jgi:ribulose 1,5-bisphosphate synthetase/thiazole synthase
MPHTASRLMLVVVFGIVFSWVGSITKPAQAGEPAPPKYDVQTETKIQGTIQDVTVPATGHEKEVVRLVMKVGTDTITVSLCPKSFLDDMGIEFNKGDEIVVTGSKVKQENADLVLAREARKGQDTLVVRDDKGNPVWVWNTKK